MKSAKLFLSSIFSLAILTSCENITTGEVKSEVDTLAGKVENAVQNLGTRVDSMSIGKKDDKEVVQEAVRSNQKELQLLAAGQKMGTSKEVKDAAKKMLADHEKLGKQVKEYASKNNIELPQDSHDMDTDIDGSKGAEWDRNWVNKMVDMHQKDIDMFQDAEGDVKDPQLKTLVSGALPKLRSHLEMSKQLQTKMNQ